MPRFGESNRSELGNVYLRPVEDEPVEVILLGEARVEKVTFNQQTKRSVVDPEGGTRVICNAYYIEEDRLVKLEGPKRLASALYDAKVEMGVDVVRIIRTGSGFDTKFSVKKLTTVSDAEKATIEAFDLHDLSQEWREEEDPIGF